MVRRFSWLLAAALLMRLALAGAQEQEPAPGAPPEETGAAPAAQPDGPNAATGSPAAGEPGTGAVMPGVQWLARLGTSKGMGPVAFSPDGRQMACGSGGSGILLWDLQRGVPVRLMWAPKGLGHMVFSLLY